MSRAVVILAFLFLVPPAEAQFRSVRVQIIDRGQADGILIRTPNERWVVIDAGVDKLQAEAMKGTWGIDQVDLAIVSHRHYDHYGGMDDVLNNLPVNLIVMNMADCDGNSHDDTIRQIISDRSIPHQSVGADTFDVDGVRFILLPPDPTDHDCPDEENDNSIIVRMEFGEFSMLFTGDAETDQRQWLMQHHPGLLDVDVLKAAHHGADNGADGNVGGRGWMDVVDAEAVVISSHLNSRHGHPQPQAIATYEGAVGQDDVYCTSRQGTIRVYGRRDGRFSIHRQFPYSGSCQFGM